MGKSFPQFLVCCFLPKVFWEIISESVKSWKVLQGVVEFVKPSVKDFVDWNSWRDFDCFSLGIHLSGKELRKLILPKTAAFEEKLRIHKEVLCAQHPPVFYEWFLQTFPDPESWYATSSLHEHNVTSSNVDWIEM